MATNISSVPTSKPVTTSGWYDRTDGTVGLYVWREGVAELTRVVDSWNDVTTPDYAAEFRAECAAKAQRPRQPKGEA